MGILWRQSFNYIVEQRTKMLTILLIVYFLPTQVQSKMCTSLHERSGVCISIRKCPSLLQILSPRTVNRNDLRQLQKLTCGFDKNDPKVCCPIDEVVQTKWPNNKPTEVHPNLHNLPTMEVCGLMNATLGNRIIGGAISQHAAHPWLVRLGYYKSVDNNEITFYCGGSIINKRYILTAAHCVTGERDDLPVLVRVGEYNTSSNPDCPLDDGKCSFVKDISIEKIILHSGYSLDTKINDIALIQLSEDLTFDDEFIRPICLPHEDEFVSLGMSSFEPLPKTPKPSGFVSGWGATQWDVQDGSDIVRFAFLPVVPNERCQAIYRNRALISSKQMCAGGEDGKDSCDGDSGGPLVFTSEKFLRYFQVGIVSYGPTRCGSNGLPGIYTRVTEYIPWILDHLEY